MHPTAAPSKFGHHRKQRSLDYRELEAFTTDTHGKKQRDRAPPQDVDRNGSTRMGFEDRQEVPLSIGPEPSSGSHRVASGSQGVGVLARLVHTIVEVEELG
jgi:hypothetical protein